MRNFDFNGDSGFAGFVDGDDLPAPRPNAPMHLLFKPAARQAGAVFPFLAVFLAGERDFALDG